MIYDLLLDKTHQNSRPSMREKIKENIKAMFGSHVNRST